MDASVTEVARLFRARYETAGANLPGEVYPGYPGLVVEGGSLRSMVWGFPLARRSKRNGRPLKPKPVNNARMEKLDTNFWRHSLRERRCLIPLTAWAEAEGPTGARTRTWLGMPYGEPFACAGLWRESSEWGPCYSMIMQPAAGEAAQVHSRMPSLLGPNDCDLWTDGSAEQALALIGSWNGTLKVEQTDDHWTRS